MAFMVIRVRGTIHARHDIRATLDELHLTRANHATLVGETPTFRGMLAKVQGYVTWGEAEPETVRLLLAERGIAPDGARLKGAAAGAPPDIEKLTQEVAANGLLGRPDVKPLFRLKAPRGGWRSTKKPFPMGGALGYRGRTINELARRMV